MIHSQAGWFAPANKLVVTLSCAAMFSMLTTTVAAQARSEIREYNGQLADLMNAFDVTQAKTFESIVAINAHPAYTAARAEFREHMDMMKRMTMSEMMASGMDHGSMGMGSSGPYVDLEVESRINLLEVMRGKHSDEEAAAAYVNSSALDRHTAEVFTRGRNFESRLFAIYVDDSIRDKKAAVNAAIAEYLSDDRHSVPTVPKESDFIIEHPEANGLKSGFPRFSGFLWTQQWLQLAALEAAILEELDPQFSRGLDIALERFWNKIGSVGGMSMFPPPSELPMAPAIAPDLYSQSPEAAIILDNLNILETVVADILSYPNLEDRAAKIEAAVLRFTNKDEAVIDPMQYLLFALRGGIYDQGGPAVGELTQSERNRTRAAMDMQHAMIMSVQ